MAEKAAQRKKKQEALVKLYEESYSKVARYVFVRIGNQTEAEDLASETFVKALKSLDSYQERGLPMEAWIFRIAHNLVVDHLRKVSKRQMVAIDEVPIRDSVDPEEEAEIDIESGRLLKALDHLSPAQREVISLRFFSDLDSSECGKILGKKPGAVREMQSAAIKALRKVLDQESGS
ncbi:MAG: sigma-70 family RNA polymerase sigma factor [bacterium]|nr:sigma-70 family RNA polymerase sigma factor [bacterium]